MEAKHIDLETLRETPPWEWPEQASAELLAVLRDPAATASDRRLAAELGGEFTVVGDEIVAALLSILNDANEAESLRATAAISLGPVLEYADEEGFEDGETMNEVPITPETFGRIQATLHRLYHDPQTPDEIRRRVLEASVRAEQGWHPDAVRLAYYDGREPWRLTAVFCMRFVPGFEKEILMAVADESSDIRLEAISAAGNWQIDGAWSQVASLIRSRKTEKPLLLAAIEAAASIRPEEAPGLLDDLLESKDEEIAETVQEALTMAEGFSEEKEEEEEEE